jgi:hypothetical protein
MMPEGPGPSLSSMVSMVNWLANPQTMAFPSTMTSWWVVSEGTPHFRCFTRCNDPLIHCSKFNTWPRGGSFSTAAIPRWARPKPDKLCTTAGGCSCRSRAWQIQPTSGYFCLGVWLCYDSDPSQPTAVLVWMELNFLRWYRLVVPSGLDQLSSFAADLKHLGCILQGEMIPFP